MLTKRWGHHHSCKSKCHSDDHKMDEKDMDCKHHDDGTFNTGNSSEKKLANGNKIRGGDNVTFVNTGDNSFVLVLPPVLSGNVIAPVIDLLSNPQLLGLGAVTGFNDADPKVDIL